MIKPAPWTFKELEEAINQLQLSDYILFPRTHEGKLRAQHQHKYTSVEALNNQEVWYTTLPLLGTMTNHRNQFSTSQARRTLSELLGTPHSGGVRGKKQKYYVQASQNNLAQVLVLDVQDASTYKGRKTAQLQEQERQALLNPTKYRT